METGEKGTLRYWVVRIGAVCAALTAIVVFAANVDSRYQKAEASERLVMAQQVADYAQDVKREEGDLRTQINLIQLELQFIAKQAIADEARKTMLLAQLSVLLTRLTELQK